MSRDENNPHTVDLENPEVIFEICANPGRQFGEWGGGGGGVTLMQKADFLIMRKSAFCICIIKGT